MVHDRMWLLLDIGNSSAKVGLYGEAGIIRITRVSSAAESELVGDLAAWLDGVRIERSGGVSVVPATNPLWRQTIREACGADLELYDAHSRLSVRLTYRTPDTLGNDRVAAVAAAWSRYGGSGEQSILIVDAGTAVTYDVVLPDGVWPGGIIAPGPELLRRAMREGTAQLPEVELESPPRWIGTSTREAVSSGIMNGFLAAVEGTLDHLADQERDPNVVLTGGWGSWLTERIGRKHTLEPDLVLEGVARLMELR